MMDLITKKRNRLGAEIVDYMLVCRSVLYGDKVVYYRAVEMFIDAKPSFLVGRACGVTN